MRMYMSPILMFMRKLHYYIKFRILNLVVYNYNKRSQFYRLPDYTNLPPVPTYYTFIINENIFGNEQK